MPSFLDGKWDSDVDHRCQLRSPRPWAVSVIAFGESNHSQRIPLYPNYPVGNRCVFTGSHYQKLLAWAVSKKFPIGTKGGELGECQFQHTFWHQEAIIPVSCSKIWNFSGILWVPIVEAWTLLESLLISYHKMFSEIYPVVSLAWIDLSFSISQADLFITQKGTHGALFIKVCPDPGLYQQNNQTVQFCYILSLRAMHLSTLTGAVHLAPFWAEPVVS